jgi:uncharacterized protein YbjT (DUF2867 family)
MSRLILLTGASGYVGGRLLAALEERGERVRCLSRRPELLRPNVAATTEVVEGDVLRPGTVVPALAGVDTLVYLVHSMSSSRPFADVDREAARAVGTAAREAGVRKIVYLGGLGTGDLSEHLASRQEVGRILRHSGVPTIELRASIVIGSGSASFEMIRALVERLPVMVTPRWVHTRTQPIAIDDVLAYLLAAIDLEPAASELVEIGGADAVTYLWLMREYARQRGLRRVMVPVPVLSPRLSSLWLGLVTPVHAGIGRKLVDSLRNPTVVHDRRAAELFPRVHPRGAREAIARALANEDREFSQTRFSDEAVDRSYGGARLGSRLVDRRSVSVPCPPHQAFAPIQAIGGDTGWYAGRFLWRVRGALDWVVGGPGLRRGRRDPHGLRIGDAIDFWRVEAFEPDRLLRLAAEMRVPGRAWLQFEVEPDGACGATITQTALFEPAGLAGLAYWYALWPLHGHIFGGMLRNIADAARRAASAVDGEARAPAPR